MGYIGRYTAPSIVDLESPVSVDGTTIIENGVLKNVGIDGIKLKSSGNSITKSDGTTAVLSESDGVVTLNSDQAVIEGSSSGDLVRISQTGSGNALVVEDSANPDSTPLVIDAIGRLLIGNTNAPTEMASHSVLISNDGTASFSVDPSSDDLVIDREAGGITIYGHTGASAGRINFGTATNNAIGSVAYFHTDNSMRFEVNDQERMRIDSNGFLSLLGTGSILKKTITIADDAAGTIVLPNQSWAGGICIVSVKSRNNYPTNQGVSIFWFDAGLSLFTQSMVTLSALFTTGTLTGTTGTDGVTTYSVINSPSRAIVIENREGLGTLEYSYLILQ